MGGPKPKRNAQAAASEAITPPEVLQPNQSIARVLKAEGRDLYICELPSKKTVVAELAARFRNIIFVRRGGFVLLEAYASEERGGKIQGEMVNVVGDEKLWRKQSYW
jgi:probable RNA-binding protein EIF1AD